MSFWQLFWVAFISVFCALGVRNAYQLYRSPREIRTSAISLGADQAQRAALATLIGLPVIWLLIVLSSFGLLGPSPF